MECYSYIKWTWTIEISDKWVNLDNLLLSELLDMSTNALWFHLHELCSIGKIFADRMQLRHYQWAEEIIQCVGHLPRMLQTQVPSPAPYMVPPITANMIPECRLFTVDQSRVWSPNTLLLLLQK